MLEGSTEGSLNVGEWANSKLHFGACDILAYLACMLDLVRHKPS